MLEKSSKAVGFPVIKSTGFLLIILLIMSLPLFSSNLSDATALREKCEREAKILNVSVKNFGDEKDKLDFQKGEKMIKMGKVKFIQSKYPAAIEKYNNYLKLQHSIYASLAKKYINRTEKVVDETAEDLVDHIDNLKVEKYFRLASQNLRDAKSTNSTKHYKRSIDHCRIAKNYAISAYKLVGKKIPQKYMKDLKDYEKKIY